MINYQASTAVLAALALCCAAPRAHAEGRRALVVGIDTYAPLKSAATASSAPGRNRGWFDLEGAVNDAEAIRQILVARFGFDSSNVHVLKNAEATRARMLDEIEHWLVDAATSGDVSFFYYAGHGSQVRNSRSRELDKLDESIVPADSNLGVPDIRDKELATLFNRAIDKRIVLTAVFDSCHSGSIGRGMPISRRVRRLAPIDIDVAEPADVGPRPEDRGALLLSAAQDFQLAGEWRDEDGTTHGVFTWALMRVLRSVAVTESADRVFLRVRAMLQAADPTQEPSMAGSSERRRASLFGTDSPQRSGHAVVAVQRVDPDGTVVIQAGLAAGLRPGAELSSFPTAGRCVLHVFAADGLSRSRASIIVGTDRDLAPGDLFEISRSVPSAAPLRVWVGDATRSYTEVLRDSRELVRAGIEAGLRFVHDPTADQSPAVAAILERAANGWQLRRTDAPTAILGETPDAATIRPYVTHASAMLNVPFPSEAARVLRFNGDSTSGLVEVAKAEADADYILVGRPAAPGVEYAWMRPHASGADSRRGPLPVRTDWIPLRAGVDAAQVAFMLQQYATRLATIHAWLQLESPPDTSRFPYRLGLLNLATGLVKTSGTNVSGETYRVALTLDRAIGSYAVAQRYVYVFAIDHAGTSTLLFPSSNSSRDENLLPVGPNDVDRLANRIELEGSDLRIAPPFGVDTFVLLTTATPLPDPSVLTGEAVRASAKESLLARLLSSGSPSRQAPASVDPPVDWSIERLTFDSRPGAPEPPRR